MGFKGVFIARTCFPDENECAVKIPNNDVDIIDCVFQELNLAVVGSQIVGLVPVADLEGVRGVRSNPPPDPNYSIFMGNFKTFCVKLGKRTPLFFI